MEINISEIKKIAKKAGRRVLEIYNTDFAIEFKDGNPKNPLTEADLASNKIIKKCLKKYNFPILSEESIDDSARLKSEYVWIVDPVDGTSDFIEKTGEFAIMIGLVQNRKPVLGVVYEPVFDRFYFAEAGKGAFREQNGHVEKIQVSDKREFKRMKILVSRNHLLEREIKFSEKMGLGKMTLGSAGLKICRIAEGEAEIYLNTSDKTSEWDTCAGNIILKEAGGMTTDMKGKELGYNGKNPKHLAGYVASNSIRHNDVIKAL